METGSTAVALIRLWNDIKKSMWRTHRYFVDFESWIHVKISPSNRCHNFHKDLSFKINRILTNFPREISTSNRWRIDEDVSIGMYTVSFSYRISRFFDNNLQISKLLKEECFGTCQTPMMKLFPEKIQLKAVGVQNIYLVKGNGRR